MHTLKFLSSVALIVAWTVAWTLVWTRTTNKYDHRRETDDVVFLVLGTWVATIFVTVLICVIWTLTA